MSTQTDVAAKRSKQGDPPEGGPPEVLVQALAEQLVAQARASGVSSTGPGRLLSGSTKQVLEAALETALETEMAEHLGHRHVEPAGPGVNVRNACAAELPLRNPARSADSHS